MSGIGNKNPIYLGVGVDIIVYIAMHMVFETEHALFNMNHLPTFVSFHKLSFLASLLLEHR